MTNISRLLVLSLILCSLPFHCQAPLNHEAIQQSPKDFVQQFYGWYLPLALKGTEEPAQNLALREKSGNFSKEVYEALKEDSDAQAKADGEIVGLDFDPFLATQDPCEHYVLGKATGDGERYEIPIFAVCSGKQSKRPDVVAQVERREGSWVFINFYYPKVGGDLLSILKRLRKDPLPQGR